MTLHARRANIPAIPALCLGALCLTATPAAAQSSGSDIYTLDQDRHAPPSSGAPAAPAPPAPFPEPEPEPEPLAPRAPPAPIDARNAPARWQINGGLSGSVYTIQYGPDSNSGQDAHGNTGSIYLEPILFLTPVVDNDAPHSLQPFLQRTSEVYASISGGGFVTRYANVGFTRKSSHAETNVGVDAYLTRNFALTGGFGYGYGVLHEDVTVNKQHSFSGSAGFGVRIGDARLDASYNFNAYDQDGTFAKLRWGAVGLRAYVVFAQSFALTLGGYVSDGGGGGSVDLGYYPTKDLGLFAGFLGQTFVYYTTDVRANRYTGSAGISYWVTPSLRFYWSYSLQVNDAPVQPFQPYEIHGTEHALSLNVLARLP